MIKKFCDACGDEIDKGPLPLGNVQTKAGKIVPVSVTVPAGNDICWACTYSVIPKPEVAA